MNRREFLATVVAAAPLKLSPQSLASEGWRIFEIKTHVHVQNTSGATRVWLPTPLVGAPYQQTLGDTYLAENGRVVMVESDELDLLYAEWGDGADPVLDLTSRVAVRAHRVDLARPSVPPPPDFVPFERFLRPTTAYPLDAAFKARAAAVAGSGTDLERAHRIFDRVRLQLLSCDVECRDASEEIAAFARAAGIPARVLYGLTLSAANATKAQHARAEVYLVGFGWVPLDVASSAFGAWGGDWIAFNSAQDVTLPKTKRAVRSFAQPRAETANGFANSLDPAAFRYEIAVRADG